MKKLFFFLFALFFNVMAAPAQTTWYVDATGTASGAGTSWSDASNDLQRIINTSSSGDMIYVAQGTYLPQYDADDAAPAYTDGGRDNAFILKNGVSMYGGFAGTESSHLARTGGQTILSGDIDGDGALSGNAYHVVISTNITALTVFDGFTITGGNADGSGDILVNSLLISNEFGGGMFNRFADSNLEVTNVTISENYATGRGGGMYNENSSCKLDHVIISNNTTEGDGGGIHNRQNSSPMLTNVTISGNSATGDHIIHTNGFGGGMANEINSSPELTNVQIFNNEALAGGGMVNTNNSSPKLINVAIFGNSADFGGGMYNVTSCNPNLTNVTISGNSATGNSVTNESGGGMVNNHNSSPRIINSIIWGNRTITASSGHNIYNYVCSAGNDYPEYYHSLVEGSGGSGAWVSGFGDDRGFNIDGDPEFVNWQDPGAVAMPASEGDYRIQPNSDAIDIGDDLHYVAARSISGSLDVDLAGRMRLFGPEIDMGAYESHGLYFSQVSVINGTGSGYFEELETVTVTADTPAAGERFDEWTSANPVTFASSNAATTTFDMPSTSASVPVTVTGTFETVFTIGTQPSANTTVIEGSISGSLSVAVNLLASQTLSYQWYENTTNSNTGGTAIAGETNASFTIPATLTVAASPYFYYCVVSATGGTTDLATQVAVVTVISPVAPTITGPAAMTLITGYAATSSSAFTIAGSAPVTVTAVSSDSRITWNNTTKCLDIAAGLPLGSYSVVLTASNGIVPDATFTFTLTVAPEPAYNIIVLPSGYGLVTANKTTALAGETIILTVIPNKGYELASISASSATLQANGVNSQRFIMPASNVTITSSFKKTARQLAWEKALPIIESAIFTLAQDQAISETAISNLLAIIINELIKSTGFVISANDIVIFTLDFAIAGDLNKSSGTNGYFGFRVTPPDVQDSAYNDGTITATPYIVGNENPQESTLRAWVQNGVLHVDGLTPSGKPWYIYHISGKLVFSGTAAESKAEVSLSQYGLYIVMDDNRTVKIIYSQ